MNYNPVWKTSIERDENGQFASKNYGEKKLRSMKLTDHAWNSLEAMGDEVGISRTDVIEELTRHQNNEQQVVLKALNTFIELKRQSFGSNAAQRGKEFSINARTWDAFREFFKLVETSPRELRLDE